MNFSLVRSLSARSIAAVLSSERDGLPPAGYPLFPGENEVEQIQCIMEVLGPPSKRLIQQATRRKQFFGGSGACCC